MEIVFLYKIGGRTPTAPPPLRPTRREEERRWQSHQIGISLIFWRASVTLDRRAPATDFHHNCWFHTQSVVPAPQNSEEVGGGEGLREWIQMFSSLAQHRRGTPSPSIEKQNLSSPPPPLTTLLLFRHIFFLFFSLSESFIDTRHWPKVSQTASGCVCTVYWALLLGGVASICTHSSAPYYLECVEGRRKAH